MGLDYLISDFPLKAMEIRSKYLTLPKTDE
jgi:hypothetical protein